MTRIDFYIDPSQSLYLQGSLTVKFAWRCHNNSGTWGGGWFATKEEAISAANHGAYIVEKLVSQRVCGTSEGGKNDAN